MGFINRTTDMGVNANQETTVGFNGHAPYVGQPIAWDGSNPRLTCRRAGLFAVQLGIPLSVGSGNTYEVKIKINGSGTLAGERFYSPVGGVTVRSLTAVEFLSIGDYIEASVWGDGAFSVSGGYIVNPFIRAIMVDEDFR
jgi:hypothetical protein